MKLATQAGQLAPPAAAENEEMKEERGRDEALNDFKVGCLTKALNFLKQTLQIALSLNDLI